MDLKFSAPPFEYISNDRAKQDLKKHFQSIISLYEITRGGLFMDAVGFNVILDLTSNKKEELIKWKV